MQGAGHLTHHDARVPGIAGGEIEALDLEQADVERRDIRRTALGGVRFGAWWGTRGRVENDDGPQQVDAVDSEASAQGRCRQVDFNPFGAEDRLPGRRAVGDDDVVQRECQGGQPVIEPCRADVDVESAARPRARLVEHHRPGPRRGQGEQSRQEHDRGACQQAHGA